MDQKCTIAPRHIVDELRAVYIGGLLFIGVRGNKPTPCTKVKVKQAPYRIFPPHYMVDLCVSDAICIQVLTPYVAVNCFPVTKSVIDAMGGAATVHFDHAATERVKIEMLDTIPVPAPVPGNPMGGVDIFPWRIEGGLIVFPWSADGGGGDVPFPFKAAVSESISVARSGEHQYATATGISESHSFDEAYRDAINNLPPDPNPYPDKMLTINVVNTRARIGGLHGLNRMEVTVEVFY
jgi:hypothetical protein